MRRNWRLGLAAALIAGAASFGAIACDDENGDGGNASGPTQQSIDELAARVQHNEMIVAVLEIESMPLHEIHLAIGDGKVPPDAIPTMRTVARLTQITYWSSDLATAAAKLHDDALALIAALEDGDLELGNELAGTVHEGGHQFVTDAWEILAPGTGPGGEQSDGGDSHDDGAMEGDATPAADDHGDGGEGGMDMTPEAEMTP